MRCFSCLTTQTNDMRINIDTISDLTDYSSGLVKISLLFFLVFSFSESFIICDSLVFLQLTQEAVQEEQGQNLAF